MLTKEAAGNVLSETAATLRALNVEMSRLREENSALKTKIASVQTADEIVDMMEQRGLSDTRIPRKEKVAQLLDSGKDLRVMREALSMKAPDMSFSTVAENRDSHADPFMDFLLGG